MVSGPVQPSWFNCGPRLVGSAAAGNLLEKQNHRSQARPTDAWVRTSVSTHPMLALYWKDGRCCFIVLWPWLDPVESGSSISLLRQWAPLGPGATCRREIMQLCRRPPTERSNSQLPLAGTHFPLSASLWSHWIPITIAAIIVISPDSPKASLRACRLI